MTVRTKAELLALYADNSTGDISAQDLRDFVDTVFAFISDPASAPLSEHVHANLLTTQTGPGKPSPDVVGAAAHWDFAVGDALWPHFTLPAAIDTTQDIVVHVDFAPDVAAAGQTVSFQLEYLLMGSTPKNIDTIEGTLTAIDVAVPATQWADAVALFTIPAAGIADGDHEVKMKLTRIASTNDPTVISVHHIWAEVLTKPPGAS